MCCQFAARSPQNAKPAVLNNPNLTLAGRGAAPDTWRCLRMNVFEESGEYLGPTGMPVIPNASERCFPSWVGMELDSFVRFTSAAAALITLDSVCWGRTFSFCKKSELVLFLRAVLLRPWQRVLVFVSYEGMLTSPKSLTELQWPIIHCKKTQEFCGIN